MDTPLELSHARDVTETYRELSQEVFKYEKMQYQRTVNVMISQATE